MNIALRGYFGLGNFGDEIFAEIWRRKFAGHNVFIDRYNFTLPRTIIIGGGDILFFNGRLSNEFNSSLLQNDFHVYGIGVPQPPDLEVHEDGVSRPDGNAVAMADLLKKARSITCRDARSVEILRSLGVDSAVAPDLAFSYRCPVPDITKFQPGLVCGLVVFSYDTLEIAKVVALAKAILGLGFSITIIPMVDGRNPFNDIAVCEAIAGHLPKDRIHVTDANIPVEHKWSIVRGLDLMVSFKMHPSLAALREAVPTIAITDQEKIRELFKLYGLEDCVFPQVELEVDAVAEAVTRLSRQRAEIAASLRATTQGLEAQSDSCVEAFVERVLRG